MTSLIGYLLLGICFLNLAPKLVYYKNKIMFPLWALLHVNRYNVIEMELQFDKMFLSIPIFFVWVNSQWYTLRNIGKFHPPCPVCTLHLIQTQGSAVKVTTHIVHIELMVIGILKYFILLLNIFFSTDNPNNYFRLILSQKAVDM